MRNEVRTKQLLLASDFDKTLSFDDSGEHLSQLLGVTDFDEKVVGLAAQNFVQAGAELSYLLLHDPAFRHARYEHLVQAGKRVQLKRNVGALQSMLQSASDEVRFHLYVVSAAPQEIVESALEGIVPASHIIGTRFKYADSGEIESVAHCTAGYGKVVVIDSLHKQLGVRGSRIAYMGDGSSDIHVMLHVNRLGGMTIAVSENKYIKQVASRVVLSDDVLAITIPLFEEFLGYGADDIQEVFERHGFVIQEWDKTQADNVSIETAPDLADEPDMTSSAA
jgi:2-hydroxy-3-keto-5-methylthiopentenyl-1-phosphate phosphatase